jgi:FSR family fosmidomycin resistance protein-like MFS transporter
MSSRAAVAPQDAVIHAARQSLLPLILFCVGHFLVDLYSGALGALQPVLQSRFGLNFTQAGILGGVMVCSSSVMQPVYGLLSDRWHSRLFTVLAPGLAGIFISSLGLAPGYMGLLAMVWMGGAGIASFHPQAAANATAGIERNRSGAMAIFICSGTAGLACGPIFFSTLAERGLALNAWGALPGVLVSLLLLAMLPPLAARAGSAQKRSWHDLRAVWRPLTVLYFLVFIRSIVQITFTQFLPLYLHTQRGYSLPSASAMLSLYLVGGAIGGLAGGRLADRFGGRLVIIVSMIGSVPFLALFVFTTGIVSAAALFLGGLFLLFTIPVNVVMAQELAPAQAGTVSALMMGFAWGAAGLIFIPLTGWVSDLTSMQHAFSGLIAFPLIGFLLALKLPKKCVQSAC